METKHTPGPWEVTVTCVLPGEEGMETPADWVGVQCADERHGDVVAYCHPANAPVIAAAPDLLAALDGLFEHCAMVHKHWGDEGNARQAEAAIVAARAAIAKAKGEG